MKEIETLKLWSDTYYKGEPLVSDLEFDTLYRATKEKYPNNPYFSRVNHNKPTLRTVKHVNPMLSLETEVDSSINGLYSFDRRIRELLGKDKIVYTFEMKYDGLGIDLLYENGYLVRILTRGDGIEGEDVSHCLPLFGESIPKSIPHLERINIRGEAMMSYETLRLINEKLELDGKKKLSNPRNAAAGTVRTLDVSKVADRTLSFFVYWTDRPDVFSPNMKQHEVLANLYKLFPSPNNRWKSPRNVTWDLGYIYSWFQAVEKTRPELEFPLDGVVYKVDDLADQEKLGYKTTEPRWALAHKFIPEKNTSYLNDIELQIGRTGKVTPVAKINPVFVGGVTVTSITLHNIFDLRRRNVRVGDLIEVQRGGDVIPEIVPRPRQKPRVEYVKNIRMSHCPSCDSLLVRKKGEADYYCENYYCSARVLARLEHFVSRSCMDIKGLGTETLIALINEGGVNDFRDLYKPSLKKVLTSIIGKLNTDKVITEIELSKTKDLWRFIHGLGIDSIGLSTSKKIAETYPLHDLLQGEHFNFPEIGPVATQNFVTFFQKERKNLIEFITNVQPSFKETKKVSQKLKGCIIVVTGVLKHFKREEFKALVESHSGKVSSTVTGNTTYFVAGDHPTKHKVDKAKALNVPVFSEEDFKKLIEN